MESITDDHLDHTLEISSVDVRAKAVKGIALLMGRGFFLNLVAQVSQFFLLALLAPEQMGVFWIVSAVVGFLVFFSDIGLAAALIQKKNEPSEAELRTTFFVQQVLVSLLILGLFIFNSKIAGIYGLSSEGRLLLYALGISLIFSSLKSIPSVLLERKLEFGKFIMPELIESVVYSVLVVFLAWRGFGLRSFTIAVLVRGIVGVVVIYYLRPWRPGFALSKSALRGLFKFGVPYQFNSLVAIVKDRGITLALGVILGDKGVGFFGTAERIAQTPLRLFMDPTTKVSFPAFSRMQENMKALQDSVERSLMFISFTVFPSVVGFVIVAPVLLDIFPQYGKWEPSLIPLTILSINVMFGAVTTQLTNLLSAIGEIKVVTKLILMWTILTVLLVPLLASIYGVVGAALGQSIVSSTSVIAIYIAKRHVNFSLTESVLKVLTATIIMGSVVFVLRGMLTTNLINLLIMIIVGASVYLITSYMLIGDRLISDSKKILVNLKR